MKNFNDFFKQLSNEYQEDVEKTYETILDFITSLPKGAYCETNRFEIILYNSGASIRWKREPTQYFLENHPVSYSYTVVSEIMRKLDEDAEGAIKITERSNNFTLELKPLIP